MAIHLYFSLGPVDGNWEVWSPWSKCDGESETRQRSCENPAPTHGGKDCHGDKSEERQCDLKGKQTTCDNHLLPFAKMSDELTFKPAVSHIIILIS